MPNKSGALSWLIRQVVRTLGIALLALQASVTLANTVTVVTSRFGNGYDEVIGSLRQELAKTSGVKLHVVLAPADPNTALPKFPDGTTLVVTVGTQAGQQVVANAEQTTPVLSIFLPRSSFEGMTSARRQTRKLSAVFIDQPYQRQLNLIQAVLPSAQRVGIVTGPGNEKEVDIYRSLARSRGMSLVAEQALRETELYPVLQTVLRASDVLLAIPDAYVVNATTAQNLLLTSFRFRIPVIGYSASYVKAGALAAVFSTPSQIGLEAGQIVRQFMQGSGLPQPKFSIYFTVAINQQVANGLGYKVGTEAAITQRLLQLEGLE